MYPYNNSLPVWYPYANGNPPLPAGHYALTPFSTNPCPTTTDYNAPSVPPYIPNTLNAHCTTQIYASHTAPAAATQSVPAQAAAAKDGVKYRNGTFYDVGVTYEGVVTRRSAAKGFGFLRATHRLEHASTPDSNEPSNNTVDVRKIPLSDCVGHIFMHESHVRKCDCGKLDTNTCVRFSVALHRGRDSKQAVDIRLAPVQLPPTSELSSGINHTTDSRNTVTAHAGTAEDTSVFDWSAQPYICPFNSPCYLGAAFGPVCRPATSPQ